MAQLSLEAFKKEIDKIYSDINNGGSAREHAEMLYAIIGIKGKNKELAHYVKPLYVDVKAFIKKYLESFEIEDYGYDVPNNSKLVQAICYLPLRESVAMFRYARKQYESYGHETESLDKYINKSRMSIAWKEHRYLSFLLHLSSHNAWTLVASYLLFFGVLYLILLPAPLEWMGVLQVEAYDFGQSPLKNHLMNTMALVAGGDYAPSITPQGFRGMMLILLGKITFYLLIGNFVVKKLTDLLTFE